MQITATTKDAYDLMHRGTLVFSDIEQYGLRIDVDYSNKKKEQLTKRINRLEKEFQQTKFWSHWTHIYGGKANIGSDHQLAHILYDVKKLNASKTTGKGRGSTDEETLRSLNLPELEPLLEISKLKKIRDTYLDAFVRETVDDYIHPHFNLHLVKTHRSCVAKGTSILAVRDFIKYPRGIPIEKIKIGDFVYCYDDALHPTIKKVLWAGKTGYKEIIRLHWKGAKGNKGHLDVTPEHLIRHISGKYVEAQSLMLVHRPACKNKHAPKVQVLSCRRVNDLLFFTGNREIQEHRFIYSKMVDCSLKKEELVHHKDRNHLNHVKTNLQKMSASDHARLHAYTSFTTEGREKGLAIRNQLIKDGMIVYKKGEDCYNWLGLSKLQCLKMLARYGGHAAKLARAHEVDFDTFKKYLRMNGIDVNIVRLRYDRNGEYITRGRLQKLQSLGRAQVSKELGIGYYRLLKLYKLYGIDPSRRWGNQFGAFTPHNHAIVKIEWLNQCTDVYDIEVEDCHNFIANEICVHNSSSAPNFQNIPKRDEAAMNMCRRAIFPRPGHLLMETDFSGMEVKVACCYNEDPKLIADVISGDMHKDMAIELYMLDGLDKSHSGEYNLRQGSKNGFVFPEFYGSFFGNCAPNLIEWAKRGSLRNGTPALVHLSDKGLIRLDAQGNVKNIDKFIEHVKKIEDLFWNTRYKVYTRWKNKWWAQYQRKGYIELLTGFRCDGVMSKNDCTNYPIQGSAFHCLLQTLIWVHETSIKESWDSHLVSQIHDSMLTDTHPEEQRHVYNVIKRIACEDLLNAWKWIIVPMEVEFEATKIDAPWSTKEAFELGAA